MTQLPLGAKLVPQLFAKPNDDALGPVKLMPAIDRVSTPVLVNVTDCEGLEVPTP
jgi:hypothetical protein